MVVQLAAPAFVFLIASGFSADPEKFDLATLYTRIMFPYLMMMSLVGLFSGILNSFDRFAASAGAPLALNVCLIIGVLIYADAETAVTGMAASWAVFVGGLVQLGILLYGAHRRGFLLRLRMPRLSPDVRRLFVLGAPGFISAGAVQINLIVGTNIASQQPGAVSWLMNADQLYQLPLALIGIALAIVLLPVLSRRVKEGDDAGAARALNRALELSSLLVLPAAAALLVMNNEICDALFRGIAGDALALIGAGNSAFTPHDVQMTGAALASFAIGLPAFVWLKIFSPAFFAREDTKTPMRYAIIAIVANIVLALALFDALGFVAVAIATSLAAWLQVGLLAMTLYQRGLFVPGAALISRLVRVMLAATIMGVLLWLVLPFTDQLAAYAFGRSWVVIVVLAGLGAIVYGALALILGAMRREDITGLLRGSGS